MFTVENTETILKLKSHVPSCIVEVTFGVFVQCRVYLPYLCIYVNMYVCIHTHIK